MNYTDIPNSVVEYFWKNVDKTNMCWNWIGLTNWRGAPIIIGNKESDWSPYSPRKLSLLLANKLANKPVFPFACKNKLCVNPAHLGCGDDARFWAKVSKLSDKRGGCWAWIGTLDDKGYGQFTIHNDNTITHIKAHTYSWQNYAGLSVSDKMVVCHKCDHPYCVNPEHLFLGSQDDNMKDMVIKGRSARGEKS